MRNMSFALTTSQAYTQVKTVTRRMGWATAKPGQLIQQVEKGMGLKAGETIKRIHVIKLEDNMKEQLSVLTKYPQYGMTELIREGFPNLTPGQFVEMFCDTHKGCTPETAVNRLSFVYTTPPPACPVCRATSWEMIKTKTFWEVQCICASCNNVFEASKNHAGKSGEHT